MVTLTIIQLLTTVSLIIVLNDYYHSYSMKNTYDHYNFNEQFITSNIRQRIRTQALGKSKSVVKIAIDSQSLLLLMQ